METWPVWIFHRSYGRPPKCPSREGAFAAGRRIAWLAALGWGIAACKSEAIGENDRQWVHCTCSYISDFDEPGRAPIDVCTDGARAEEVAAVCARNDGVGIPTSCRCEATRRGPCAKADRCRPGAEGRP